MDQKAIEALESLRQAADLAPLNKATHMMLEQAYLYLKKLLEKKN